MSEFMSAQKGNSLKRNSAQYVTNILRPESERAVELRGVKSGKQVNCLTVIRWPVP
jgi:hypothetical protein